MLKFLYLTEAHWGLRFEQSLQVLFLRSSRFESSERIFLAATWSAISTREKMIQRLMKCKMKYRGLFEAANGFQFAHSRRTRGCIMIYHDKPFRNVNVTRALISIPTSSPRDDVGETTIALACGVTPAYNYISRICSTY
jgi:hypothetical protein